MRAISIDRWMEPSELQVSDIPEPSTPAGALKVKVRAAGCNFFDILMVQGKYQVKPPFPFTPGAEVAGVIDLYSGLNKFNTGLNVEMDEQPWYG